MAEIITENQLRTFLPTLKNSTTWTTALNTAMVRFDISSPERAAGFLAQVAHESAEFQRLVERLSYSATRLMAVWPRRFPTLELARRYERQPERLASYVYANRIGNGDAASGDGWRFRGRGILQITGRGTTEPAVRPWACRWRPSPSSWNRPSRRHSRQRSSGSHAD